MAAACAGFGTYVISIVTAPGDCSFVGSLVSRDAVTGGARRLHKTGVGSLQVSTEALNGSQGEVE